MPGANRIDGEAVIHMPGIAPAEAAKKAFLVVAYIIVSACLIRYNKYLMMQDHFPYSMFLTACHMFTASILSSAMYICMPAAFPGAVSCEGKKLLVVKWMIPIGIAFAVSLFTSNQAYIYCNVTFLQFMKEANVIICFLMSCAVGLQSLNRVRVANIVWIIAGSTLAVHGELHFAAIGFVFQLISQFAECSRTVMGEIVLGGGGLKLDPLSYTLFVSPTCLAVLLLGNVATWDPAIPQALAQWWPYLLPNALLAFVLNVLVASIIKEISAVGFILAGVCKDIVIVMFSAIAFREPVTSLQAISFTITLAGVFCWSYVKAYPDSEAARGAERILGMPKDEGPTEKTPFAPAPVSKV